MYWLTHTLLLLVVWPVLSADFAPWKAVIWGRNGGWGAGEVDRQIYQTHECLTL